MQKSKPCIECQKSFFPRDKYPSERWTERIYCCLPCCQAFRRRVRHRQPHPPAVVAALAACKYKPSENRSVVAVNDLVVISRPG